MLATKLGYEGWLLVAALALGSAGPSLAQERGKSTDVSGILKSVDAGKGTITISVPVDQPRDAERRAPATTDKTFPVAKNVEVATGAGAGGGRSERGGLFYKEVKLADLAEGVKVSLSMSPDQKTVEGILAEGPTVHGQLKAIDAGKGSLTILFSTGGGREGSTEEEKTFTLLPDAEIAVDDGRGSRFSVKEAKLADLAKGAQVTVQLFVDMSKIQSIVAEGPRYHGIIKALDPAKGTLTLAAENRGGDNSGEYSLVLANDAVVLVDEGRGGRLSVKQAKLTDLPVGCAATVKLSADQVHVKSIRAEGPTLSGQLKSVDPANSSIVIAIPKGRGEDPEEKTLTVAKDARITVDGNETKLADLKAGDNPTVSLHLSLDGKAVRSVTLRQSVGR
jgi:hypothetical protein